MSQQDIVYTLDIKKVQGKVLEIFVEFDRICRKHNLRYSMEGGTLLGAVKYGGFVPWDDDVDVIMPREDYEKFLKVAPQETDQRFFLESYNNVSQFPLNYSKFCLTSTKILNYTYSHLTQMHHGIFIDIFPIDNVKPGSYKLQCALAGALTASRSLKLKVIEIGGIKGLIYRCVSLLPVGLLNKAIQFFCTMHNKKATALRYEVCNPNLKFPPLKYNLYENYTELEFEGRKFYAVQEYDYFLQTRFGENYMNELPAENLRYPSHGYDIWFEEDQQ